MTVLGAAPLAPVQVGQDRVDSGSRTYGAMAYGRHGPFRSPSSGMLHYICHLCGSAWGRQLHGERDVWVPPIHRVCRSSLPVASRGPPGRKELGDSNTAGVI